MFVLGDVIPAAPRDSGNTDGRGTVVYIHPMGRFYLLRFDFPAGSFCESRSFTPEEVSAGLRQGLFPALQRERAHLAACGLDPDNPILEDVGRGAYSPHRGSTPVSPDDLALL